MAGNSKRMVLCTLMRPDEVRIHREERKRLSSSYKQLLNEVSAILFRHDPIGINFEYNTDEYDPEAGTEAGSRKSHLGGRSVRAKLTRNAYARRWHIEDVQVNRRQHGLRSRHAVAPDHSPCGEADRPGSW